LRNLELESAAGQANADLRNASARAAEAGMRYQNFGPAERDRQQSEARHRSLTEETKHLQVTSPMQGSITTPKLHDLMGAYLKSGTEVAEVADMSVMTARVYIPEFGMRDVHLGALVRLHAESQFKPWTGTLTSLAPSPSVDAASLGTQNLEGIRQPKFYIGRVELQKRGDLREGLSGDAKILVGHRSVAGFAWRFARDLVGRRMW
jgi:multidrug resistance efflux pump